MRLLRVELSRFFSRRAVAMLLLTAALLTTLIAVTQIWNTRPVGADELAEARSQVAQQLKQPEYRRELRSCQAHPTEYFGPDASAGDCEDSLAPRVEFYLDRATLSLDDERDNSGIAVVVIVAAVMIMVGTTFAGADWATGSMSNQLLFEPRRLWVWSAKALASLIGCLLSAGVLLVGFWLVLYLVAQSRGIDTGASVQEQVRWMVARGVALAGFGGLGGYALTMLLRHTVGTLALLFAYAAGGEALLALAPLDRASRFSPATNVFAWIRDGVRVFDSSMSCPPGRSFCEQTYTVTLAHSAVYLSVLLVLALVASALTFHRRDVP